MNNDGNSIIGEKEFDLSPIYNNIMLSDIVYKSNNTMRFNKLKLIDQDSISTHMHNVTVIFMRISVLLNLDKNTRDKLVNHCILHDLCETQLGDIHTNIKKVLNKYSNGLVSKLEEQIETEIHNYLGVCEEYRELTEYERKLFKIADYTDILLKINSEIQLGNMNIYDEVYKPINELLDNIMICGDFDVIYSKLITPIRERIHQRVSMAR